STSTASHTATSRSRSEWYWSSRSLLPPAHENRCHSTGGTMRTLLSTILTLALVVFTTDAFAQEAGDFRSAANGNWSDAATWETFDGTDWVAAGTAPTGDETITIA